MKIQRTVVIIAALTLVITLYSVSELHSLTSDQNFTPQELSKLDREPVWRAVADKAFEHVEHLPQINLHPAQIHGVQHTIVSDAVAKLPKRIAPKADSATDAKPGAAATDSLDGCNAAPLTEFWGDVVRSGDTNKQHSAAACCASCKALKPADPDALDCNVWVWCADEGRCGTRYGECWLKHLVNPRTTKPQSQGPGTIWTSGMVNLDPADVPPLQPVPSGRKFHIVTTAQGPAVHWQMRVHYYHYKKQRAECERLLGDNCEMGGFTRVLHSGNPDDLMGEIPTMVVDPLPESRVPHSSYVVLNRPYALQQWVERQNISERYVLMAEPDQIFLRPLPNFIRGEYPASFPFFYIEPYKPENKPMVERFTGRLTRRQVESIAPIGNSPTFLSLDQMRRVMPLWLNTSIAVFKDPETNKKWGWIQEMYAYTISQYMAGIRHTDLHLNLMAQPPWESAMSMAPDKPFYILHYTYGNDFNLDGTFTPGKVGAWHWDKRQYVGKPIPRQLPDPPRGMNNDMVRALIAALNEATAAIPCWDVYAKTGKVPPCAESSSGRDAGTAADAASHAEQHRHRT